MMRLASVSAVMLLLATTVVKAADSEGDFGIKQAIVMTGDAQENAKFQRDLLRCTKLADVHACEDALRSKPDDPQLRHALARIEAKRQARTVTAKSSATPTHSNQVAGATDLAAVGSSTGVADTIHYSNDAVAGQTN